MPVQVKGTINNKAIDLVIKDGAVRPFFLGEDSLDKMVIIGSDNTNSNRGLHFIVAAGLWYHRRGMPMSENESLFDYRIRKGDDKRIENEDEVTMTNPDKRENSIKASYLPARSKR